MGFARQYNQEKPIKTAYINNREMVYDGCCDIGEESLFDKKLFKFIGNGKIYKIGGVSQSFKDEQSFFIRIDYDK